MGCYKINTSFFTVQCFLSSEKYIWNTIFFLPKNNIHSFILKKSISIDSNTNITSLKIKKLNMLKKLQHLN